MTQPDQTQAQILAAVTTAAYTQQAVTDATTRLIQGLWRTVNPYNTRSVREFTLQAGRILVASQRTVADAHVAAQQVQLQALGINRPVTVTIPDNVRGATVDFTGRTPKVHAPAQTTVGYDDGAQTVKKVEATPDRLLERAAETYRYEQSQGKDHATANDIAEQRITKLVDNNMILSARLAQQQTLKLVSDKDARVVGYRRIIHPELSKGGVCGMCVAASDRVYKIDHLREIHTGCWCSVAPVVKMDGQIHDPGHTLNQDDLDRLYAHAAEAAPGARATSAAALKKTRYQIVDHHELGPVLTKVTGEPVPYGAVAA